MSLIDKARESQVNSYFKLEEDYQSLVDHAQDLERQLDEARELIEDCLCQVGGIGIFNELNDRFKQLKEQG